MEINKTIENDENKVEDENPFKNFNENLCKTVSTTKTIQNPPINLIIKH